MIVLIFIYLLNLGKILGSSNEKYSVPIKNLELNVYKNGTGFPSSFSLLINEQGHKIAEHFEILNDYSSPPISILENGKVKRVNFSNSENHRIYREKNGRGFATLIENKHKTENDYRIFARIFKEKDKSDHYDIVHKPKNIGRFGVLSYEHFLSVNNLNNYTSVNFEKVKDYKFAPKGIKEIFFLTLFNLNFFSSIDDQAIKSVKK